MREHGYKIEVQPAEVEELMPPFLTVGEITLLNAKRKAERIAQQRRDDVVVAADTLVSLDGKILGKPRDLEEAADMLGRLSGRTHDVYSGVWIKCGEKSSAFIEI